MCYDRNAKGMVGPKKRLKAILDIRPNVGGISTHFP